MLELTSNTTFHTVVELQHQGVIGCHALLIEPAMKRTIFDLVALIAVMRKHDVGSDQVVWAETATIEDREWSVLMGARESAPKASDSDGKSKIRTQQARGIYPTSLQRPFLISSASSGRCKFSLRRPEFRVASETVSGMF